MPGLGGILVEVLRRGFGGSLRDHRHPEGVDAAARCGLADLVTAYLRGEIMTSAHFSTRCNAFLDRTADPDIPTVVLALQCCIEDRLRWPVWLSEEQWHAFRRVIAYLNTEYRLTPRAFPVPLEQRLAANGMLLLWVSALLACVLLGHTMLALAAWVAIGVLWQGLRRTVCVPDKTYASVAAFAPFRSEADWREHEGVLESYGLPPYDPSRYREPGPGGTYLMGATNYARTKGPWTLEPWGPVAEIVALPVALILFQRPALLPMIDGAASQMADEVGCLRNPDFGALPHPDTTPPREP